MKKQEYKARKEFAGTRVVDKKDPVSVGKDDPIALSGRNEDSSGHKLREFLQRSGIAFD